MTVFPNAKINIGLNITGRRTDGFHDIETVFYPVKIYDALEIIPDPEGSGLLFSSSGLQLPGAEGENLSVRAFRLLEKEHSLPPVKMHLHKNIPSGAGLGGGSSDAAFTLRLLNELFGLGLNAGELRDYARQLGSDCAFFIESEPVYAFGKGDEFRPVALSLDSFYLIVAMPEEVRVSTSAAYAGVTPRKAGTPLEEDCTRPPHEWKKTIKNDFEAHVFGQFPELGDIKAAMYDAGAVYASMSGSGSAVYGFFERELRLPSLERNCRVFYDAG